MYRRNTPTEWSRKCPKCGGIIYHATRRSRDVAERGRHTCGGRCDIHCKTVSKETRERLRAMFRGVSTWKNKYHGHPPKRRSPSAPSKFSRTCPQCGRTIYYSTDELLRAAERKHRCCMACTAKKHKFFKNCHGVHAVHKMRASKAGFSSWKEYQRKMPVWKQYRLEVWRLTNKTLRNNAPLAHWNLRGICGRNGAYQVDHIVSIREGFDKGIRAETIASYKNLRMIPWQQNLRKGKHVQYV